VLSALEKAVLGDAVLRTMVSTTVDVEGER
jgi:hypothetical protein